MYGVCYTQAMASDSPRERAEKTRCSSLARQKLNFKAAYKQLQLLLCANFRRRDLYITLGFDDEHLPPGRKEAKKIMAKFMDRLRARRRADGQELKYVYATQDDGSRRLHFHLVLNAAGGQRDYELIRSLWEWGSNIEIIQVSDWEQYARDDFLELAQYLLRERNPDAPSKVFAVGDKGYVCSRNLAKPVRESRLVDDNVPLTAPPGAEILDRDERQNGYGCYTYISYLLPEPRPAPAPSRRRIE